MLAFWPSWLGLTGRGWAQTPPLDPAPMLAHHAAQVEATYADTLARARSLQAAVRRLVAAPSVTALAGARTAWLLARERYAMTEAFRFYGGPIDGEGGPEPRINSWPVDEAYIEGLLARSDLRLDKATLSQVNLQNGEENVATGWHAIEFLLWGRDRSETGPGDRSHTDYLPGRHPRAARLGRYLLVVTELLRDDLDAVHHAWLPAADNYRRSFEHDGMASVRRMIVGLGTLSRAEIAGERMEVPLASQDQEDEQSCFSDSTHQDLIGNALGIEAVWLGRYAGDDGRLLAGPSLRDLVATREPALAEKITREMARSIEMARGLRPPFDREIVGDRDAPGRLRVRAAIDSVTAQAVSLVEAARALGLQRLNGFRAP
jgi:putative iron-regulated protein